MQVKNAAAGKPKAATRGNSSRKTPLKFQPQPGSGHEGKRNKSNSSAHNKGGKTAISQLQPYNLQTNQSMKQMTLS